MFRKSVKSETQPTNNWHVLRGNIKPLLKPYSLFVNMDWAGGIGIILYTPIFLLTLPCTLIKTVVDINTRKKMSTSELNSTITSINKLGGTDLDRFVNEISTYENAKSNSSRTLLAELNVPKKTHMDTYQLNAENNFKKQKELEMKQQLEKTCLDMKEKNPNCQIDLTELNKAIQPYELSYKDRAEIFDKLGQDTSRLENEIREQKKAKIISFLNEPYNAGKQLQHIMKNKAEEITKGLKK